MNKKFIFYLAFFCLCISTQRPAFGAEHASPQSPLRSILWLDVYPYLVMPDNAKPDAKRGRFYYLTPDGQSLRDFDNDTTIRLKTALTTDSRLKVPNPPSGWRGTLALADSGKELILWVCAEACYANKDSNGAVRVETANFGVRDIDLTTIELTHKGCTLNLEPTPPDPTLSRFFSLRASNGSGEGIWEKVVLLQAIGSIQGRWERRGRKDPITVPNYSLVAFPGIDWIFLRLNTFEGESSNQATLRLDISTGKPMQPDSQIRIVEKKEFVALLKRLLSQLESDNNFFKSLFQDAENDRAAECNGFTAVSNDADKAYSIIFDSMKAKFFKGATYD